MELEKRAKTKATKVQMDARVVSILAHLTENVYGSQKAMIDGISKLPEFSTIQRVTIRGYLRKADRIISSKQMRDRQALIKRLMVM